MEQKLNAVEFIGMKASRSIKRYIELQIEKWIEREQSLLFLPKSSFYRVIIEKEDAHCYQCAIEIRIGIREWRAYESGRTLPEALSQALKYLKAFAKPQSPHLSSFVA